MLEHMSTPDHAAGEIANANEAAEAQPHSRARQVSAFDGRIDNRSAVKDLNRVNRAAWL